MILGARTAWQKAGGVWVNPYVTDGLVAMWDGEWNAGGGVHDAGATTWVDVVNGLSISLVSGMTWINGTELSIVNASAQASLNAELSSLQPSSATIEIVSRRLSNSNGTPNIISINSDICLNWQSNRHWSWLNTTYARMDSEASNSKMALLHGYSITPTSVYFNGASISTNNYSLTITGTTNKVVIGAANNSVCISNIRAYSRALTASEIAANYAIDAERFNLTA